MTDILKPELIWIEGRCYRLNDSTTEISALQEHDLYDNVIPFDDKDNNEDDDNFEVVMIDNTRYRISFHIAQHYYGYIIGKKGAIKNRIERDTRTEIKIPKQGQTGEIVIFGSSASNVKAARRRINIIVMSSRMKQKATHFISIPMNHANIIKNFNIFKENVIRECSNRGIDESLFIKPEKLHLTIGVMCLMDNEERLHASKLLTEAKEKVLTPLLHNYQPLKIRMKGLSYMNDDPREVDVLYASVEEVNTSGILQRLADSLVEHFHKAGFMQNDDFGRENVKLHVTLMNSKYRSDSKANDEDNKSSKNSRKPRETFDGSIVLENFANFDFGIIELDHIHLSQRHTIGPDGYYQPTCIISCKKI